MEQIGSNRLMRRMQAYANVQYALVAATILLMAFFYLAVYRPQREQMDDLMRQIAAQNLELQSNRSQTSRLPRVSSELNDLKRRLAGFKTLPARADVGEFDHEIHVASQRAMLTNLVVAPQPPQRTDLFSWEPIRLSFHGNFANVYSFIQDMEDNDRLTRVRNVQITSTNADKGEVDVTLEINIYYSEG